MQEPQVCCRKTSPDGQYILTTQRKVTLSVTNVVEDWLIRSTVYPPTASSRLIFASDVPFSWTYKSRDVKFIPPYAIVQYLIRLPVEHLSINKASWLSEFNARELVTGCRELEMTDFRDSGAKGARWAIKGTNHEVVLALISTPN